MHWLKMMMACPRHVPHCVCVSLRVCLGVVECRAGSCALQVVFECVVTFRLPLRSAVRPRASHNTGLHARATAHRARTFMGETACTVVVPEKGRQAGEKGFCVGTKRLIRPPTPPDTPQRKHQHQVRTDGTRNISARLRSITRAWRRRCRAGEACRATASRA